MARALRWDPCVAHRGEEADSFLKSYFGDASRKTLLIAGAGFDPRSTSVASRLADAGAARCAVLFQEQRTPGGQALLRRADANLAVLQAAVPDHALTPVEIFGPDGAVVGGRNVVSALARTEMMDDVSDIIVDVSALSVGTSFPIIRYLQERAMRGGVRNLHVFVTHDPELDGEINPTPSDAPSYVHGFKGGSTLDTRAGAAKLWLPQLAKGRRGALARLHDFVSPHDTCPILPFPASRPRAGDLLAEEYVTELENAWAVDTRNIVYADEGDPLDLYRTILRLDDLRKPVFAEAGGSLLVLSPLGSKVMALGALMAALERDLPVAYLESIAYELNAETPAAAARADLVHIWLEGDAYPGSRPLFEEGREAA